MWVRRETQSSWEVREWGLMVGLGVLLAVLDSEVDGGVKGRRW